MPEGVTRLVGMRLMPVVTVGDRDGAELDGELLPVGQGEQPGAEPVRWAGVILAGESPGTVAVTPRRGYSVFAFRGLAAAMADGVAAGVGNGDAPGAVWAAGRRGGQVANQRRVEGA